MPYASGIQLINDANGAAYAFLADNGLIWQCQWDAEAQRWDKGQVIPDAQGGEKLQALYVDDLWPNGKTGGSGQGSTTNPGIVLAYRVVRGVPLRSMPALAPGMPMASSPGRPPHHSAAMGWRITPSP